MSNYAYINPNLIINSLSKEQLIVLEPSKVNLLEINEEGIFICSKIDGNLTLNEIENNIRTICKENSILFSNSSFNKFINDLITNKILLLNQNPITDKNEILESIKKIESFKSFKSFNPKVNLIIEMNEGYFSKIFIDVE